MLFHDCNGKASKKIVLEEDDPMQWNTQAGNITANLKVRIYFTLPALSARNFLMWNFCAYDSAKGGYGMVLG